jgi:beta-ribofuranosylaminobenzene 5'-phosphate synthase
MSEPTALRIVTGARLHRGPLTNGAQRGRMFGGIGLMIDAPRLCIEIARAEADNINADRETTPKIAEILAHCRATGGPDFPVEITLREGGGLHRGLGSGTQLGMSVVAGLSRLAGRNPSRIELSRLAARGKRSALGVHGFCDGGFLVDGGKRTPDELGTLAARTPLPHAWRVLLIAPPAAQGLSGAAEEETFRTLEPMSESLTNHLCRLVLLEILPALAERDFARFSESLHAYGAHVGDYFSSVQHGRYADPQMARLVEWLRERGIAGVGQTSWGPTIFAFTPNAMAADELRGQITQHSDWQTCQLTVAAPMNNGAVIEVLE